MTLETQYKYFKQAHPESTWTFEEWRKDLGERLSEALEDLEKRHPEIKQKPKTHHQSVEHLYHFNCGDCKQWWSIGDYKPNKDLILTCPHCGFKSIVSEV